LPERYLVKTEVCIIGAGAAGITLAREFVGQEFRVCLLESGDIEFNKETQALYKGENVGLPYFPLDECRYRYFGGTTNAWEGRCRPFDEIDFEASDWIPNSGWPFGKSHLDPFYERAQSICQLGPFTYDVALWKDRKKSPPLPFNGDRIITKIYQMSPPTKFGEVYRDQIARANNVSTYLNANIVDIETDDTAQAVTRVRAATLEGNEFWVSAKLFILATGGIENARLLMLSNKVQNTGLGNQNDLVGRFFTEHPNILSGIFLASEQHLRAGLYQKHIVKNITVFGTLSFSEDVLRREKLANINIELRPWRYSVRDPYDETSASKGVKSLSHIYRSISQWDVPDDFWMHLRNMISDIDDVAIASYRKLFCPTLPVDMFKVYIRFGQVPNRESRVTLAEERDRFGKNRVRLDWRLSTMDNHSVDRTREIIGLELGRAGLGRLLVDLYDDYPVRPLYLGAGRHHMGMTRMHIDPKQGVADENCKVHGISNLFVAGSSVFPTVGYANPVLTIVALAVRLGDHVKKILA
jgi:choline dehydrogenase-like flavoprotein